MSFHIRLFHLPILAIKRLTISLLLLGAAAPFIRSAVADSDILYVCDADNDLVRRFDARTGVAIPGGNSQGVYVLPGSNGLNGPRGIFPLGSSLFLASQNLTPPGVHGDPGEILRYKLFDGRPDGAFVPSSLTIPSPFTPDGIIYWKGVIYASDFARDDRPPDNPPRGKLLAYDAKTGKLLRQFDPPENFAPTFHPRGLVIGPNGLLYVANMPNLLQPRLGGQILVFDPETLDYLGAFINDPNPLPGESGHLNRPDSLVFGPDGKLYVTSFRDNDIPDDTDSIRIYDGHTGVYLEKIDLYTPPASPPNDPNPTNPRAYAQGIIFGPGGKLFVAITGAHADVMGRVRKYDVKTKDFTIFAQVPTFPALWYLVFGKSNPGTLAYDQDDNHGGGPKRD